MANVDSLGEIPVSVSTRDVRSSAMAEGLIHLGEDETVQSAIEDVRDELTAMGVKTGSYHLTPAYHSQLSRRTIVTHFGFPPGVFDKYLEPYVFEHDPIPDYVMRIGRAMTWKQALEAQQLSPAQRDVIDIFVNAGLAMENGVAIPLFGPNGRDSYSAFTFDRAIGPADEPLVMRILQIAQIMHRKVCLLVERDYKIPVAISKRENEVLYWMARGKSNADVAQILGISPGTVDTFVRRLYQKLNVNDRISAIFQGMSRGLVKL